MADDDNIISFEEHKGITYGDIDPKVMLEAALERDDIENLVIILDIGEEEPLYLSSSGNQYLDLFLLETVKAVNILKLKENDFNDFE